MAHSDEHIPSATHILHHFDVEIAHLREKMRQLGDGVVTLWGLNHKALIHGNLQLASDVLAKLGKIKNLQLEIELIILEILAKQQPVASDLRLVLSMIKFAYELRSMIELAHEMSRLIIGLYVLKHSAPSAHQIADIANLDLSTYHTIAGLIDSLNNLDADAARRLFEDSLAIESSVQTGIAQLIGFIQANPHQISPTMNLLQMLKALESCNRSCKNFAEYFFYMVDGVNPQTRLVS